MLVHDLYSMIYDHGNYCVISGTAACIYLEPLLTCPTLKLSSCGSCHPAKGLPEVLTSASPSMHSETTDMYDKAAPWFSSVGAEVADDHSDMHDAQNIQIENVLMGSNNSISQTSETAVLQPCLPYAIMH